MCIIKQTQPKQILYHNKNVGVTKPNHKADVGQHTLIMDSSQGDVCILGQLRLTMQTAAAKNADDIAAVNTALDCYKLWGKVRELNLKGSCYLWGTFDSCTHTFNMISSIVLHRTPSLFFFNVGHRGGWAEGCSLPATCAFASFILFYLSGNCDPI